MHADLALTYQNDLGASDDEIVATNARLHYTTNLATAVEDCDLVSESVPEDIGIKHQFYDQLSSVAPS